MIEDRYGLEIDLPAGDAVLPGDDSSSSSSSSSRGPVGLETSVIHHRRHHRPHSDTSSSGSVGEEEAEDIALVFLYTVDNSGPPTASQVTALWDNLRQQHPGATLLASSLDAFAVEVLAGDVNALPVVWEELGDSWLYGAPADPIKVATFREARRKLHHTGDCGRAA